MEEMIDFTAGMVFKNNNDNTFIIVHSVGRSAIFCSHYQEDFTYMHDMAIDFVNLTASEWEEVELKDLI